MTSEADLVRLLSDAQRLGTRDIDAATLVGLDRAAAYRIIHETRTALGEGTAMLKSALHPDGVGVAAPIYASRVGRTARSALPADRTVGLEVEVGVVLARAVPNDPATEVAEVLAAVDHVFVGVEVLGTRYRDRDKADPAAALADNMSAFGYIIGPRFSGGSEVGGLPVTLELGGKQIYSAPAKHGFGSVLASLVAYARAQQPHLPLSAGTVITTGSLCGLVPTSGPGHVVARLGDDTVEFDLA